MIISFKLERYVGPLFIATLFQTYAIDFAQYTSSVYAVIRSVIQFYTFTFVSASFAVTVGSARTSAFHVKENNKLVRQV